MTGKKQEEDDHIFILVVLDYKF